PYGWYAPGAALAAGMITFGVGMAVGSALWGDYNWGSGDININSNRYNDFSNRVNTGDRRNQVEHHRADVQGGKRGGDHPSWQHNPQHRGGTQYRDAATQQRFNRTGVPNAQSREAFRGRAEGSQGLARGGAGDFAGGSRAGGAGEFAGGGGRAGG